MKQPNSEKLRQRQIELVAGLNGTQTVTAAPGGKLSTLPFQSPIFTSRPVPIAGTSDIGLIVQHVRQMRGIRQQQLADIAGVGRRFLSELENGKETLEFGKVLKVAAALGIDLIARQR